MLAGAGWLGGASARVLLTSVEPGLRSPSRPTSPMNVSLKTNSVGVPAPGVSWPESGIE